jgi:nicotinate dehydrogenase subunit A
MVLLDGQAVMSCLVTVSSTEGKEITTLDGLAGNPDEQAAQCGYCTNGMIMAAVALLDRNKEPDDQEIREALQINLCRCGTQSRVIRAVKRAKQAIK